MPEKPNKAFIKQRRIMITVVASLMLAVVFVYDIVGPGGNTISG